MRFAPQSTPISIPENQQKGSPAPTGTRQRSASALRKAGRTAQGRFVMDPTHGCCSHITPYYQMVVAVGHVSREIARL